MIPTPKPYQNDGVEAMNDFGGRVVLADEMGLGKTMQSLRFARMYSQSPVLVICPASLKYNWRAEARLHINSDVDILEGQTARRDLPPIIPRITVINYEILPYWEPYLKKLRPHCLIVDECQNISNPASKRSKVTKRISRPVPHVLALSGTPLMNRPKDLWPTLNLVRPDLYPSFWSYGQRYCEPRYTRWGWRHDGADNLPELHANLREQMLIRRLKKDVLKDLPEKGRHVVSMPLIDPAAYQFAEQSFITWLGQQHPGKVKKALRAVAISRMNHLRIQAARQKGRAVVEWCNKFLAETGRKLIVFAYHTNMVNALAKCINADCVKMYGPMSPKDKQLSKDRFQNDPNCRVIVGSETMCEGHTLTAASDVAFTEMFWRPAKHLQGEDRPHRIGQVNTVDCWYLVADQTIEMMMCEGIQSKQAAISAVMDGATGEQLDLHQMLLDRFMVAAL